MDDMGKFIVIYETMVAYMIEASAIVLCILPEEAKKKYWNGVLAHPSSSWPASLINNDGTTWTAAAAEQARLINLRLLQAGEDVE